MGVFDFAKNVALGALNGVARENDPMADMDVILSNYAEQFEKARGKANVHAAKSDTFRLTASSGSELDRISNSYEREANEHIPLIPIKGSFKHIEGNDPASFKMINNNFSLTQEQFKRADKNFSVIRDSIKKLSKATGSSIGKVTGEIKNINKNVLTVDSRLRAVANQFDEIEKRLSRIESDKEGADQYKSSSLKKPDASVPPISNAPPPAVPASTSTAAAAGTGAAAGAAASRFAAVSRMAGTAAVALGVGAGVAKAAVDWQQRANETVEATKKRWATEGFNPLERFTYGGGYDYKPAAEKAVKQLETRAAEDAKKVVPLAPSAAAPSAAPTLAAAAAGQHVNETKKGDSFQKSYERAKVEDQKSQFMKFGELPPGFEFMPGNKGRLGNPEAVAAGGAMPVTGSLGTGGSYGGGGGYSGGGGGSVGDYNYTPGEFVPPGEGGKFGSLSEQRARFAKELEANPNLRRDMMVMAMSEVGINASPESHRAVMESMMNRAAAQGKDLSEILKRHPGVKGNYYAPYFDGAFDKRMQNFQNNPELQKTLNTRVDEVLAGSNDSNLGTDNSSAGVAESARRTQTITNVVGGETYSRKDRTPDTHGAGVVDNNKKWYAQTQAAIDAEKANPKAEQKPVAPLPPANYENVPAGVTPETIAGEKGLVGDTKPVAVPTQGINIEGYDPKKKYPGYNTASEKYVNENFLPAMNDFVGGLGMGKAIGENPYIRQGKTTGAYVSNVHKGPHHYGKDGVLASDISGGQFRPDFVKQAGGEGNSREMIAALGDLMFHPEISKIVQPRELINQNRTINSSGQYRGGGHPSHVHFAPGGKASSEDYRKLVAEIMANPAKYGEAGKRFRTAATNAGIWVDNGQGGYKLNPEKFGEKEASPEEVARTQVEAARKNIDPTKVAGLKGLPGAMSGKDVTPDTPMSILDRATGATNAVEAETMRVESNAQAAAAEPPKKDVEMVERTEQKVSEKGGISGGERAPQREDQTTNERGGISGGERKKDKPSGDSAPSKPGNDSGGSGPSNSTGRYNPETQGAEPGSGAYGCGARCFV